MYLIAGLGNPGRKYEGTKHNMGFDTIDLLADKYHILSSKISMKGMYAKGRIEGEPVLLLKPLTYMNLSGECIQQFVHFYKINPEDHLIIIYDDVDLEPGQIRIRKSGSAGSHNGMRNIVKCLGTTAFPRIRIGIGEAAPGRDLADYVLAPFDKNVRIHVNEAIKRAAEAIPLMVQGDIDRAMSIYNQKISMENKT